MENLLFMYLLVPFFFSWWFPQIWALFSCVSLARVAILSAAGDSVPLGFGLGLSVDFISDLAFTSHVMATDFSWQFNFLSKFFCSLAWPRSLLAISCRWIHLPLEALIFLSGSLFSSSVELSRPRKIAARVLLFAARFIFHWAHLRPAAVWLVTVGLLDSSRSSKFQLDSALAVQTKAARVREVQLEYSRIDGVFFVAFFCVDGCRLNPGSAFEPPDLKSRGFMV
jgi:hypothetical protein